jgi:hypothetical protein
MPETRGDARAQLRIDPALLGDHPLLHRLADVVAGVADDVGRQVLTVGAASSVATFLGFSFDGCREM